MNALIQVFFQVFKKRRHELVKRYLKFKEELGAIKMQLSPKNYKKVGRLRLVTKANILIDEIYELANQTLNESAY